MKNFGMTCSILVIFVILAACQSTPDTSAKSAEAMKIDHDADIALQKLYGTIPLAKQLRGSAKGILVFPRVLKLHT